MQRHSRTLTPASPVHYYSALYKRELRAILKPTQERLQRRATAIARIEERDRLEEELKERYGPELYGLYESGRFSREEADRIAKAL